MGQRGDIYVIERDERDIGGKLTRIATFYDHAAAYSAWHATEPDRRFGVQFWLVRMNFGIDDPAHCDVIEFKEIDPDDPAGKSRNRCCDAPGGWPSGRVQQTDTPVGANRAGQT